MQHAHPNPLRGIPRPRLALSFTLALLALGAPLAAQELQFVEIGSADAPEKGAAVRVLDLDAGHAPLGQGLSGEIEPNDTPATATPLTGDVVAAIGNIFPNADNDWWSFPALTGDRVYVATQTSYSSNSSSDSFLEVVAPDGTTVLEADNDDGVMGGLSSTIAGVLIPSDGTYYVHVRHNSATSQLRPYELHFALQRGAPTPEVEPNDTPATANPLPAGGWVSGARDPAVATEQDWYSFTANAGDTVFLSLDLDPERDVTTWNGRLGIGLFGDAGNQILVVDDSGAGDTIDSEAMFMTVRQSGTYYAFVDSASAAVGGPTATYSLSVRIHPATPEGVNCTTYTSTDVPQVIPAGGGLVSSTITVPGNPRIADVDVAIQLDHLVMADIDAHLRSPAGNDNGIFTDIGASTAGGQVIMNTVFDDEAGIPPLYTVMNGPSYKPELNYRLSWFDGEDGGGVWTLDLRDDANNANGGNLTGWSLTICEAPATPTCAPGTNPVTVYSSDFEADDGGFTHSGTLDEWERGLPSFNPLLTCASGTNCWVTDLDNTYDASSNQDLVSPAIDLTGMVGPVVVSWAQRYHIESASFDHFSVTAREIANPANATSLFEWTGATMNNSVGTPSTTINESAGWGTFTRTIDSLAGLGTELVFHLDSDSSVNLAGVGIDDVSVTACAPAVPSITLDKTVGDIPMTCAATDAITVPYGTLVTYCYTVTNDGSVTFNFHDLDDDVLGTILDNFPYVLVPGDSVSVLVDDTATATVTNTATWTAVDSIGGYTIDDTITPNFVDISGSGTPFVLSDDEVSAALPIGFTFDYFGVGYSNAYASSNGFLTFLSGQSNGCCSGDPIPTAGDPDGLIAAWWEDLDPGEPGAGLYYQTLGSAPNRVFVVQFTTVQHFPSGNPVTFQYQLHEGTNVAEVHYVAAPSDGGTHSAGIESEDGTVGLQYFIGGTALPTPLGVRYTPATASSASAVDSATVTVTIPDIGVSPGSLSSFQPVDTQIVEQLGISSLGDADLSWSITEDAGLLPRTTRGPGRGGLLRPNYRTTPPPSNEVEHGKESFSRAEGDGPGERVAPQRGDAPDGTVTITHSVTQNIVTGNSVSCNAGGLHTDNSYIREFDLAAFGITGNFAVTDVEVGIEQAAGAGGSQPVDVNLYLWNPADPFTFANFVSIGSAAASVPDQSLTIVTIPVSGTAPSGSHLVVEFFTPNGQTAGNSLFVGSNPDGQTAPTYLAAAACGVPEPLDTAVIGFPNMHLVMNVTGQVGCDVDLPWVSENPNAGVTAPGNTDLVDVTFDSTGLLPGATYTGALCIDSNDPDTPQVQVPLTLEVDGMPFLDGFETGDTSRWSFTTP